MTPSVHNARIGLLAFTRALDSLRQEPPAVSEGLQWLAVAAESGVAVAATLLGQLLYGFAPETSVRWLESAEADDPRATYLLGLIAFHGRPGVPADHALARRRYLAAAERGNADAMFEYGLMLLLGHGGARNEAEAQAWEQRAAEAGHARACLNLGARAARREGGFRRMTEAVEWYKRAADAGSAEAAARLSRMYASGDGVAVDDAQSQYWFAHASSAGYRWSRHR